MNIVLVHGSGGSERSWSLVAPLLASRGHAVIVADNPSQSLEEDTRRVRDLIDPLEGPIVLVGHSYGGAVITNAGVDERVAALVYVAAFVPDAGESVQGIVNSYPPAEVSRFFTRGPAGEWIPEDSPASRAALAWDVPDDVWATRHNDRRTSADAIFTQRTGSPAWATTPSWYLLATSDKHIRVEAQREMASRAGSTVLEVDTSHAVPHAAPERVVAVIEAAIDAVTG
ncbi:pimeloyl-ACP methyl ester carboxylesterase [Microbacterium sp. AG1240]|uniref:alpha/beta fold hydrolase n=1 Tax=Microbacterium sp. AG1240 TaxID=2183992 RepID=UPI000EAE2425|nr:alpha/beta hydrolase [Microbacterium sp. AG1240]RKT35837.1 pimeloyl-ACP methyl ester carboxylesterase [Microbacterium sp. AG1240]